MRPSDWWVFQAMAQGDRNERLELERRETPRARRAAAAYEAVSRAVNAGGSVAIGAVLDLLDSAPHPDGIGLVAAGPLEDLLHIHGAALVDELDACARRSPLLAEALAGVWIDSGLFSSEVESRLGHWVQFG